MSDDNTITAEQYEELKAKLEKVNSDLEFQKTEAKNAFTKRDELKQKLEAIEKEKLETNNEFKTLYEKANEEKGTLLKQIEELNPFKERWTSYETARKETLLKDIEDPDLKKVGEKLDLLDLETFAEKVKKKTVTTDAGRGGNGNFNFEGKKWDEISPKDKEELAKNQPELYKKLYYEKYRRMPNL